MAPDHVVPTNVGPDGYEKLTLVITERDIVFNCPECQGELVVDRAGEGIEVPCSHCGHLLVVPSFEPGTASAPSLPPAAGEPSARDFDFSAFSDEQLSRRSQELAHQLKENRSQDTEMRGHVNRATIELHRLKLRLSKLQERSAEIEAEIAALERTITPAA